MFSILPCLALLQGYAEVGQTIRALQSIKVGADYITSCSISDSEFVVQVGTYALDLVDLNSPEDMTQARPVYTVNATNPGGTVNTLTTLNSLLDTASPY